MSNEGSVTRYLQQLKAGDRQALQRIWEGSFGRLVGLARQRLRGAPRRAADEEDVALSASDSFCRGAGAGRFPRLADRNDLGQVLVALTLRKAANLTRDERTQAGGRGDARTGGHRYAHPTRTSGSRPVRRGESGPMPVSGRWPVACLSGSRPRRKTPRGPGPRPTREKHLGWRVPC
jgi:hypothetical protein